MSFDVQIPRWPGDDPFSAVVNMLVASSEMISRLQAIPPLYLEQDPMGFFLALDMSDIALKSEAGAGGGGTIAIEEVDGTPAYTGIATLRVDSADGFVLSQPAAGIARLDIAAATASQA